MAQIDYFAANGYALELLAQSEYHRQFPLGQYFRTEILPPIRHGQFRVYLTPDGVPTAFVTWAWLSEEVEKEIHETGRALNQNEWKCGDRLFSNDWVTPYNNIKEVVRDLTHNVFPDHKATSLRRKPDGSLLRVCHWSGVNVRTTQQETVA